MIEMHCPVCVKIVHKTSVEVRTHTHYTEVSGIHVLK